MSKGDLTHEAWVLAFTGKTLKEWLEDEEVGE